MRLHATHETSAVQKPLNWKTTPSILFQFLCRKQKHLQDNAQQQPQCWLPNEFSKSAQKSHLILQDNTNEFQLNINGNTSCSTWRICTVWTYLITPEGSRMPQEQRNSGQRKEGEKERERREAESENSGGCGTERIRTSELGAGSW